MGKGRCYGWTLLGQKKGAIVYLSTVAMSTAVSSIVELGTLDLDGHFVGPASRIHRVGMMLNLSWLDTMVLEVIYRSNELSLYAAISKDVLQDPADKSKR